MRLMMGFSIILLLFITMAYTLLNIIDKASLLLYLGIFFFTIFAIIYSVYAITRDWR